MKHKVLLIAALAALPLLVPVKAEARDRCKQYTKTIRIDGVLEIGYGKACKHGDTWEIVKLSGPYEARERVKERIYDDLYDDDDYRVAIADRDYDYPQTHYRRHVKYSKPYYYSHAYDHGKYSRAKKHHKKHYKKKHYKKHKKYHDHSQCNGHH